LFVDEKVKTVAFKVEGMTCAACVATIENYVKNQEGIKNIKVSLLIEQADVEYYESSYTFLSPPSFFSPSSSQM